MALPTKKGKCSCGRADVTLYQSGLAISLHDMARAALGLRERDDVAVSETADICQQLAEWLFAAPGQGYSYEIPSSFADSPIGALWWKAQLWCQGDELITQQEASDILGIGLSGLNGLINRGRLRVYIDPTSPQRHGRRLLRQSDVDALAASRRPKEK